MTNNKTQLRAKLGKTGMVLIALIFETNVFALPPSYGAFGDVNPNDLRMLPSLCIPWAKGDKKKAMAQINNPDLPNPYHLCPALNALNHAKQEFGDKRARGQALTYAEDNLSYVLGQKQFFFRPIVLRHRAEVYEMIGALDKAILDCKEAIKLKPKYIKAYNSLIDLYLKKGNRNEAINVLNTALKIKPNSRSLLNKKRKIQGQ